MQPTESTPIALEEVSKQVDGDPFWSLRAKAIESYATLEQSLCLLFSHVSDIDRQVAGIIFFKIASSDVKAKIIEKLFRRKFNEDFRPFINGLVKQLRPIDIKRNEVVHWSTATLVGGSSPDDWSLALIPPSFWPVDPNFPRVDASDLIAFAKKCRFYSRLINMFCLSTHPEHSIGMGPETGKWLSVFAKPITYPPQEDHPFAGQYP